MIRHLNTPVCTDVMDFLRSLPDGCAHCCVTSPPYWGLRDYGVDGQIGLEPTLDAYVARMVEVFAEVRRVLRDDGTLFLNLGDRYYGASMTGGTNSIEGSTKRARRMFDRADVQRAQSCGTSDTGIQLKPKDLVGIPWRVAFALQADGWYLRSDIIWHKPNTIPESVKDRPTKAHEYVFLMSKAERYWYDAAAIAEPSVTVQPERVQDDVIAGIRVEGLRHSPGGRYVTNGKWSTQDPQSSGRRITENVKAARANGADHDSPFGPTRNKRSVWTIKTKGYPEAHFATFPEDLVKPCIMAGCPQGGTVLDPFGGAFTTALVATALGRNWLSCDLNPEYVAMGEARLRREVGLLMEGISHDRIGTGDVENAGGYAG